MSDRLKNLGKYAYPKKDLMEDDMSGKSVKSRVNTKVIPNKKPSKPMKGSAVRG
jgi:hypothetical protein